MRHALPLLFLLVFAASALALGPPVDIDALAGETLHYRAYWSGVPAAEATLAVVRMGPDRLRFVSAAKGLPATQWISPFDSRIESEVLTPGVRPAVYRKSGREGWGREIDRETRFDLAAGKSHYYKRGEFKSTLDIPSGVQDPLSSFFLYRTTPIVDDKPFTFDVCDGRRLVKGSVTIVGREKVETPAGKFDTVLVELSMEGVGGIFAKTPGATVKVWLTDDPWRRPVKMRSEVAVGNFTAVLQRIDPPTAPNQAPPAPPEATEARAEAPH